MIVRQCRGVIVRQCRGVIVRQCRGVIVRQCRGVIVRQCRGVIVRQCRGVIVLFGNLQFHYNSSLHQGLRYTYTLESLFVVLYVYLMN